MGAAMVPIMVAAAAAQRQRDELRVLDAFRIAGVTARERAKPLSSIGLVPTDPAVQALREAGLLRDLGRDGVYLDEEAVIARRTQPPLRNRTVTLVVVVSLLLGLGILLAILGGRSTVN